MALYATLFAIEVSLWIVPFTVFSILVFESDPELIGSLRYQLVSGFIYLFIISVVPAYFAYPQLALRGIIINTKTRILQDIGHRIEETWAKQRIQGTNDLRTLEQYGRIFSEVDRSPNILINLDPALGTILSMTLPVIVAFLPQLIRLVYVA